VWGFEGVQDAAAEEGNGLGEPRSTQDSRQSLAAAKNASTDAASPLRRASRNRSSSPVNPAIASSRGTRFAKAMSLHNSGEPLANRVVSRNPVAHNRSSPRPLPGSRIHRANPAATTWGRWLARLTSRSCRSGVIVTTLPPTPDHRDSTRSIAPRGVRDVGVTTQTAWSNRSARADPNPVFSDPAIG
jgi:hypothetical protein